MNVCEETRQSCSLIQSEFYEMQIINKSNNKVIELKFKTLNDALREKEQFSREKYKITIKGAEIYLYES